MPSWLGHPRRCQCRRKIWKNRPHEEGGDRCKRWAVKGRKYCKFHGGSRPVGQELMILPRFYSRHLTKTLEAFVNECLDADPSEQINLFQELALLRQSASHAVLLYGAAVDGVNITAETKLATAALMRDVLREVADMCAKAAQVDAAMRDKVSVHNLRHLVNQIVRVAYDELTLDDAKRFEKAIRERVRVTDEAAGTTVTPDQDARDMDATVP